MSDQGRWSSAETPGQRAESEGSLFRLAEQYGAEWAELAASAWFRPQNDGILLGPPSAGKTSFLAALQAACERVVDGRELLMVPGCEKALPGIPTLESRTYGFQLHSRTLPGRGKAAEGEGSYSIRFRDTPGSLLSDLASNSASTSGAAADFLADSRSASWLVLVVDSVNPQLELWRECLAPLVGRLAQERTDAAVQVAGSAHKILSPGEPVFVEPERRLAVQRVLVVINKIDLFGTAAMADLRQSPDLFIDPRLRAFAELTPEELVLRLDPIQTAQELLGGGLGLLRSALAPNAKLAVALVSCVGFQRIAKQEGRRLQVFGVREALDYLAVGHIARPITPIHTLVDLNPNRWEGRI